MGIVAWLTPKRPEEGFLLAGLGAVQHFLESKLSLSWHLNSIARKHVQPQAGKGPAWVSEFYLVACLFLASISYHFAVPSSQAARPLLLLVIAWPWYRLFETTVFLVGWVFVHKAPLHSPQRSLLLFAISIAELSLLFGTLGISIGGETTIPSFGGFISGVVSVATISFEGGANCATAGVLHAVRMLLSVFIMLVIVGSLIGGVLRESASESPDG